ncbi:sugar-binding protein [Paenibacillus sp. BC26]|uniref:sugar-binding protein n=1 Tax=Paenibacillus sp. BC26 TaxID=1881032 RepID=UPI0008EA4C6A|nr:sugar-binding protein [Paenibacillus sp. BC26]SFT13583.1 Carbohydrate family 9 binding domain-like [Paenibacillus sp. BC26]
MKRSSRISAVLVFAMLAMLLSTLVLPASVSAYSTPNTRGGIMGQWYFGTQAELNTAADNVVAAGLKWVRLDLRWDIVQAGGASSYDWSWPDKMVNTALSRGLKVMLVAGYTPSWANGGNSDTRYYPNAANINAWKNFLDLGVRRYLPLGVTTYELWNEPNYSVQSSPSLFVSNILIPGATAIRAASADLHVPVTIVNGAPANLINVSGIVDPYAWVTGIYANGGKNYFDALAIHPYCWPAAPTTPSVWNALLRADEIHTIMVNNGDGNKQVWATEFGYPTSGPNTVTEQQQSDYIVSAFQVWTQSAWAAWTGPMFLYTYKDGSTNLNDPESNFGLLRNNNTFKPVMSQLLSVMTNSPPPPAPATSGYGGTTPPPTTGTFNATQVSSAVTIDGNLDTAWTGKVTNAISKVSIGTVSGSSDLSGNFGVLWDSTNLYVMADINDDTLRNDSTASSDDDSIDIYLDMNHDHSTTYGADDFMYQVGYGDTTASELKHSATTGVSVATTARTGGYRIEVKIPWTTLGKVPTANMSFGFDMMINDDDDGGARDSQMGWNDGTANAYLNPSLFGDGTLISSPPPSGGGTTVYEAENGTYAGGGQQQTATNASNGKVVGNLNSVGASSQVNNVDGGAGGNATLVIRFSNANTAARTLSLYVNSVKIQQTSFAPTGSWNTFANTSSITIPLNAGATNTIKIQRDSADNPAADIDSYTVTTSSSSSGLLINGFENTAQWAGEATRTADTTKKTEGAQSIKFHYTVPSSGWANGYYAISNPYVDIANASSLKIDVYPTTQTPTGQTEPIVLKLQDQTGGVIYEDRLPNLTANQWNTVTISLTGIAQANRHQINSVNLYLWSGFTAQINGRTALDYYFDNLRVQ